MESRKSHYFYVLLCQDDSFYGDYTTGPERRLAKHNSGTGAKYTRLTKRRLVIMIHTEKFETRNEAAKAEAVFKKLARKQEKRYLKTSH